MSGDTEAQRSHVEAVGEQGSQLASNRTACLLIRGPALAPQEFKLSVFQLFDGVITISTAQSQ